MSPYRASVVVASYGRPGHLVRLLGDLAAQQADTPPFEVLVVDDGSPTPLAEAVPSPPVTLGEGRALQLLRQANAGPAAARNTGAAAARGAVLVFVDDDMRVGPGFVAAHLSAHRSAHLSAPAGASDGAPAGAPRVVLGALRAPADRRLPLVERYRLFQLSRTAARAARTGLPLSGGDVYTGNMSVPRALFEAVGGFAHELRLSEDAEFGMRCAASGAAIVASETAWAVHDTTDPGHAGWVARSVAYGGADLAVATRRDGDPSTSPWRFLSAVNPVSRPAMLGSALLPALGMAAGRGVLAAAAMLGGLRLDPIAMRLVTVSYGLLYFAGVGRALGSGRATRESLRRYLNAVDDDTLPPGGRVTKCLADIVADHEALASTDSRYRAGTARRSVVRDGIERIGFQIMIAYRVMRLFRALRLGLLARLLSRLMRHLYGSDLHWDAELAPGVVLVHGMGLCLSHGARVGPGCILFQHVTLGESIHPERREIGSPRLEANVHVAPGAVLLGPIVVGRGSKVAANTVLAESVGPESLVESSGTRIRQRERRSESQAPRSA